jgi:hypothetical protein
MVPKLLYGEPLFNILKIFQGYDISTPIFDRKSQGNSPVLLCLSKLSMLLNLEQRSQPLEVAISCDAKRKGERERSKQIKFAFFSAK